MIRFSVSGLAGSGKDTLADILCEHYGYKKDHFAFDLKNIAALHFNWDGQKDERGRHLLQQLGTDVGRSYCTNIWLIKFCMRHGLKVPGGETLPNQQQSLEQKLQLGTYWYSHSRAYNKFTIHPAAKNQDSPEIAKEKALLMHESSLDKARLLALLEFGWDGLADSAGEQLISSIEKLATDYDALYWHSTPANFQSFITTTINKYDQEKSASQGGGDFAKLVVPDCRFPNELQAMEANGFISVRVNRPGIKKMGHVSETALDDSIFMVEIENNQGLAELRAKADELIRLAAAGRFAGAGAGKKTITL